MHGLVNTVSAESRARVSFDGMRASLVVGLENAPALFVANIEDGATVAGILTTPTPAPGAAPAGRQAGRGGPQGGSAAAHTPAYFIRITVEPDGTFTVVNTRNGFRKIYRPRE
jgi:hypothetical protein